MSTFAHTLAYHSCNCGVMVTVTSANPVIYLIGLLIIFPSYIHTPVFEMRVLLLINEL